MTFAPKRILPRLSPVLLVAAVSVACLNGCHLEADASKETADDAVTGKARSALTYTYFDFIANAPGAFWSNRDGGLAWGTNNLHGACEMQTGNLEDNNSHTYLYTQPTSTNGYMHAAYTVTIPDASLHPTFTATFGFKLPGGGGLDGVTFGLMTQVNGAWITLFSQLKTRTGTLSTVTADLSPYAGQTLSLILTADAGPNESWDYAAWTDVRVVTDSLVPSAGCTINGVPYATGAVNPSISCQVCDPTSSQTAWSIRADSCLIGGQCYGADAVDTLGCSECDPLVAQTSWTAKSACDNLIVATTTFPTYGNGQWANVPAAGRLYPDDVCASQGAALGLPGTWKALFSDPSVRNLKDTVPSSESSRPVVNLHGEQLYASWDSIFTNQVWPSGLFMWGFDGFRFQAAVWTGSDSTGVWNPTGITGGNCAQWTASGQARVSDFASLQRKLIDGGNAVCGTAHKFACVLVPVGGLSGPPPPPNPPASAPPPVSALQITVQNFDGTALGTIQGRSHRDAYAWRGIPYAAAPTGILRLAPPVKATSWSGVRHAFVQPPPCAQPPLLPLGGRIGSEDCLYLNVWTPKTATPTSGLPVLVFQHGGAHMFGGTAASDDWLAGGFLDGDRFAAAQNAIVVTIQTRIGALGFLTDPALAADATSQTSTVGGGTSGNYGLLDAIQALKWVKRNIAAFGGDPNKVSFSGQSSGSTIVCDLLASPLAKDPADNKPYFSSVIMESGFCESPSTTFRQTQGANYISQIGCGSAPDKVACLRAAPLQSFVTVAGPVLGFFPDLLGQALPPELGFGLTFGPHIDGYVLPDQPRRIFADPTNNNHAKVPVIVGSNKEEGMFVMLFMVGGILTGDLSNLIVLLTCNDLITKVDRNLGTILSSAARQIYTCNPFDGLGPTKTYARAITHAQYECPARRTARALTTGQAQPVRRYWFTHRADHLGVFQNLLGLVRDIGAAHTFEVPFIFNTHRTMLWYWPSTRERDLTTAVQSYWRAFANSGDPNYSGGVNWAQYTIADDNALKLETTGKSGPSDPGLQMINKIDPIECDFWDANYTLDGWH